MALNAAQVMTGTSSAGNVAGTGTSWHVVIMWFLGAIVLLVIADPLPQFTTWLVVLIIVGVFLMNWGAYQQYFFGTTPSTSTGG